MEARLVNQRVVVEVETRILDGVVVVCRIAVYALWGCELIIVLSCGGVVVVLHLSAN
jgi:hypothetical protein